MKLILYLILFYLIYRVVVKPMLLDAPRKDKDKDDDDYIDYEEIK